MKLTKNLGMLSLGLWLLITGLIGVIISAFQAWELSWLSWPSQPGY